MLETYTKCCLSSTERGHAHLDLDKKNEHKKTCAVCDDAISQISSHKSTKRALALLSMPKAD